MLVREGRLMVVDQKDILNDTILIPNICTIIGWQAFFKKSIKQIVIPKNVSLVHSEAFCNCEELQNVFFENPNCQLSESIFEGCTNLQHVSLPIHITDIPNFTFYYCKELQEITIPDSVKELRLDSFIGCEKLRKISWKGKVYSYEDLMEYKRF